MESVTMAEVLYVPVDERGEPHRWGTAAEVTVTVFGDYWRARRDVQSEGRAIRAVSAEELRGLLEGRWGDVTYLSYHPSAAAPAVQTPPDRGYAPFACKFSEVRSSLSGRVRAGEVREAIRGTCLGSRFSARRRRSA